MNVPAAVRSAYELIAGEVERTPLIPSPALSAATGGPVHLKLENRQTTGSFKFRGATHKLMALDAAARERGVVAASTGNHGMAIAQAAARLGVPSIVFAPENAAPAKLDKIRALGAEVETHGDDCLIAEREARVFAVEERSTYVSPYNDPDVIAGQGTLGVEILEQLPELDAVIVAVGGGGLISGIGGFLKEARPGVRVIAVSPRKSAVMHASLAAGHVLDLPSEPTLSDATAGGLEEGSITFPICQDVIDEFVLVDEDEIAAGVRFAMQEHDERVEGAAGAAIAAVLQLGHKLTGKQVAVILCGANIDDAVLETINA